MRTIDCKIGPAGTAELSPGRSPGWLVSQKSPVGTTEKASRNGPEFGQRMGNSQSRNTSRSPGSFQSSLRDFSSLESLPRTASWAKFSKVQPSLRDKLRAGSAGLILAVDGSHADSEAQFFLGPFMARLKSCPDTKPRKMPPGQCAPTPEQGTEQSQAPVHGAPRQAWPSRAWVRR